MRRLHQTYSYISLISAVTAITIQTWVFKWIVSQGVSLTSGFWINLLMASGMYVMIYKTLVKAYETFGWKLLLRRYCITGTWYHEFVSDIQEGYVRRGRTIVTQNYVMTNFTAQNYACDFNVASRTMWQSRSVELGENGWLTIVFEAKRARPGAHDSNLTKEGIMHVQIECDESGRPFRLVGEYADSAPSDNRGAVTWTRSASWQHELEQQLGEVLPSTTSQPTKEEGA